MTTAQIIAYYANLLILQYLQGPCAYGTIEALVTPVVMNQLPAAVMNGFNLTGSNLAMGVQLDTLGKYAGVTRTGTGLAGQTITLDDADFITLLQVAAFLNSSNSDLNSIQTFIANFFPGELLVFDYQNMQMSYMINSSVGSNNLAQLVVTEGLLPKPMGVGLATIIYAPNISDFFGMVSYVIWEKVPVVPGVTRGFNNYSAYNSTWPFMSYAYAI